jgi:hypothetical protein
LSRAALIRTVVSLFGCRLTLISQAPYQYACMVQ